MTILLPIACISVAIELTGIITTQWMTVLWLTGHIQPWRPSWT